MALETINGFVWCPSCEEIIPRNFQKEPLPKCRKCDEWMEPYLCEAAGCYEEAIVIVGTQYYCGEHSEEMLRPKL